MVNVCRKHSTVDSGVLIQCFCGEAAAKAYSLFVLGVIPRTYGKHVLLGQNGVGLSNDISNTKKLNEHPTKQWRRKYVYRKFQDVRLGLHMTSKHFCCLHEAVPEPTAKFFIR